MDHFFRVRSSNPPPNHHIKIVRVSRVQKVKNEISIGEVEVEIDPTKGSRKSEVDLLQVKVEKQPDVEDDHIKESFNDVLSHMYKDVKVKPEETSHPDASYPLSDHDYTIRVASPPDHTIMKEDVAPESHIRVQTRFSKCEKCRRSRTKVLVPNSVLSVISSGKNDGVTCDFCGVIMERRRRDVLTPSPKDSKDLNEDQVKKKNYVSCNECGKVVLKESLVKHTRDVHEKSNKRTCQFCSKSLSGPFSLREHISAVHEKQLKHECDHCGKKFAHFSNLNRHRKLVHEKTVVTHKYVNCELCNKVVQASSYKKHMLGIHERRRDFQCQFCDKSFAQSYTLKEHTAAKHTFKHAHKCRLCDKTFAHKTNCGRHLRTVHKKEVTGKYQSELEMIRDYIETMDEEAENITVD